MSTLCISRSSPDYSAVSNIMPNWCSVQYSPASLPNLLSVPQVAENINSSESGLDDRYYREAAMTWQEALSRVPRTSRGRRLRALREKVIAAGIPMIKPEDLEREIAERRGEVD